MIPPETLALLVRVEGRVQGVGFRWRTVEAARARGVSGWVRNLPDGSVEAWIEGAPKNVAAMHEWLQRGPSGAHVARCNAAPMAPTGGLDFAIR